MIRPAKFADVMRIVELLEELTAGSKYRGRVDVDRKAARDLIQQCIHRHGFTIEGGAFVMVSVKDMKVEGFIVGFLDRVYGIGNRLSAQDRFLYCSKKAPVGDHEKLFDAYVEWAESNPKVAEIMASWTDAHADAGRIEKMYERKGFERCGGIFEKKVRREEVRAAA